MPLQHIDAPQCLRSDKALADGTPAHGFSTLMVELAPAVRDTCKTAGAGSDAPTLEVTTKAKINQLRALALAQAIQSFHKQKLGNQAKCLIQQQNLAARCWNFRLARLSQFPPDTAAKLLI